MKTMIIILGFALQMQAIFSAYAQRGRFAIGGEWLVSLLLFLSYHIVKVALSHILLEIRHMNKAISKTFRPVRYHKGLYCTSSTSGHGGSKHRNGYSPVLVPTQTSATTFMSISDRASYKMPLIHDLKQRTSKQPLLKHAHKLAS